MSYRAWRDTRFINFKWSDGESEHGGSGSELTLEEVTDNDSPDSDDLYTYEYDTEEEEDGEGDSGWNSDEGEVRAGKQKMQVDQGHLHSNEPGEYTKYTGPAPRNRGTPEQDIEDDGDDEADGGHTDAKPDIKPGPSTL